MKPFNFFIAVSLIFIFCGFIFFKDAFIQANPVQSSESEIPLDLASYTKYSVDSLASSQQRGTTILFFAATTWCQSCSALEEEIIKRQSELPPDLTILKVDYDNDKAMNQKWAVTAQHTLVVLNKKGQEVKRWLGGDLNTLLQKIGEI